MPTDTSAVVTIPAPPRAVSRAVEPIHAAGSVMERVVKTARKLARADATILLTGETGTGKEVMAHFIHTQSGRPGAFVPVNCGAIPENLLESEFFGYEKGAFTGAAHARKGRIASAEGGTLFLDEIGELPLALQVKLLRVLQERVYEPVGSSESRRANFRLIAATNRDLKAEVEAGRFRRDLYYRLFVCPIHLPALRERREDIRVLFDHFWAERGEVRPVEEAVYRALERCEWPGNVREMANVVERVAICSEGPVILTGDLPHLDVAAGGPVPLPVSSIPPSVMEPVGAPLPIVRMSAGGLQAELDALLGRHDVPAQLATLLAWIEGRVIDRALHAAHGNKRAAADLVGMQRTTLVEKLRRRQRTGDASVTTLHQDEGQHAQLDHADVVLSRAG